jgi:adenylylsulfate reductase subunit A
MIHGESYKPIVAEAAKVNADKTFNRIMVTHLLMWLCQSRKMSGHDVCVPFSSVGRKHLREQFSESDGFI